MPIGFPDFPDPAPFHLGPGMRVFAMSDLPMQGEPGWTFELNIRDKPEIGRLVAYAQMQSPHTLGYEFEIGRIADSPPFYQAYPQYPTMTDGQPAVVEAVIYDAQRQVVDTGNHAITYDTQTGLHEFLWQIRQTQQTGGFTSADRANLQIVKQGVTFDFGDGVIRSIAALMSGLPSSLQTREVITPDRVDSGSLTRLGAGFGVFATGIAWQVQAMAAGIGMDEGAPDTAELNVLQLRQVQNLSDGFEFTGMQLTSSELEGCWLWGWNFSKRIDYWVLPGVRVRFFWIVPGFPLVDRVNPAFTNPVTAAYEAAKRVSGR